MSKSIPKQVRAAVLNRPEGICEAFDCTRSGQCKAGQLWVCLKHYKRWTRHGDVNAQGRRYSPPNPNKQKCAFDGCESVEDGASRFCKMHGTRVRRHGDASTVILHADRDLPCGERNHAWTGDDATYTAMHRRVSRARGKASGQACVDCGEAASHWSYDRKCENEVQSEFGPYSTNVERYQARCVPCHKRFDLASIKGGGSR